MSKNNTLKISRSESQEFSSYLPVKFVNFLKGKLIFKGIIKQCTHPYSPTLIPTHPPTHPPKIMPHTPPLASTHPQ